MASIIVSQLFLFFKRNSQQTTEMKTLIVHFSTEPLGEDDDGIFIQASDAIKPLLKDSDPACIRHMEYLAAMRKSLFGLDTGKPTFSQHSINNINVC